MLSILIPTYNYNIVALVSEIHRQISSIGIPFEIICLDDASTLFLEENQTIRKLDHTQYELLPENVRRSKIRNLLAQQAQYDWLLFLDADVMPKDSDFIKRYVSFMNDEIILVNGGLEYEQKLPENNKMLRWVYGHKREAIPVRKRKTKPYESTLVSNILIPKKIMLQFPFNDTICDYGYEDFVFIATVRKNNVGITQIDNPVYHLNMETSTVFLKKHLEALDNLHALIGKKIMEPKDTILSRWRNTLISYKVDRQVVLLFHFFEPSLKKNIISSKPSLLLFDFYKLGYFCALKYS